MKHPIIPRRSLGRADQIVHYDEARLDKQDPPIKPAQQPAVDLRLRGIADGVTVAGLVEIGGYPTVGTGLADRLTLAVDQ